MSQLDDSLAGHSIHCPKCNTHLTSLLLCPECGDWYELMLSTDVGNLLAQRERLEQIRKSLIELGDQLRRQRDDARAWAVAWKRAAKEHREGQSVAARTRRKWLGRKSKKPQGFSPSGVSPASQAEPSGDGARTPGHPGRGLPDKGPLRVPGDGTMMYLWPSSNIAGFAPQFGIMTTPARGAIGQAIIDGRMWACDNEAFTRKFDPVRFFSFLVRLQPYRSTCLFVSVPDKVGNALRTLDLWRVGLWAQIEAMGFPVAFVAQDGQELFPFPPADQWNVLFIGGTTAWKMSADADSCIHRAQALGKRVHVGRVNSQKRMAHFALIGADTCDGTGPTFQPDNYRRLLSESFQQHIFPVCAVPNGHRGG